MPSQQTVAENSSTDIDLSPLRCAPSILFGYECNPKPPSRFIRSETGTKIASAGTAKQSSIEPLPSGASASNPRHRNLMNICMSFLAGCQRIGCPSEVRRPVPTPITPRRYPYVTSTQHLNVPTTPKAVLIKPRKATV